MQEVACHYSGPLPPPEDFAEYEKAHPGTCAAILRMAEMQVAHRHEVELASLALEERKVCMYDASIANKHNETKTGQLYALIVCIVIIIASVIFAYLGFGKSGAGITVVTLATVIGAFVNNQSRKEKKKKPDDSSETKQQEKELDK